MEDTMSLVGTFGDRDEAAPIMCREFDSVKHGFETSHPYER